MDRTKTPLGGSFENLEQIPKQTVKQIAKLPGDIVSGAVKSVVGHSDQPGGKKIDPLTGIEIPTPQRIQQLKKQEGKRKTAAIPHAQQIIAGVPKPQQQIPAYLAGKPGFSEEKVVKMHELEEKRKKELPPPVSAAKPKMGTSERRGGVSG